MYFKGILLLLGLHTGLVYAFEEHIVRYRPGEPCPLPVPISNISSGSQYRTSGISDNKDLNCMSCTSGSQLIDSIYSRECPGLINPKDYSFCCYDASYENYYCCNAEEFAMKTGIGIIIPVVISAVVVFLLITCCICCLCCSCCPWYRRRHAGTVYGKVQVPSVVNVIQPSNVPPPYTSQPMQNQYVTNTPYPSVMPQPPPQYVNEAQYAKQAPYNPSYQPQ